MKTVNVSGKVTLNGAAPAMRKACASKAPAKATVSFVDELGVTTAARIRCEDDAFTYQATVRPGAYTVAVTGDDAVSELPTMQFVAKRNFAIGSSVTDLAIDVKTVEVGGNVTLNGAIPALHDSSYAIPATLFAGTYRVVVSGGESNVPRAAYRAVSRLAIQ